MSNSLSPHELQYAGLPCPSLSQSLLKLMSIESSDAMQTSHALSPLLLLPSVFPSIRVFSSESAHRIRWPKYWSFSFSFSISPSSEYSGFISLRIDWFDLLDVQGTLKGLLQHHSSCFSCAGTQLGTEMIEHRSGGHYGEESEPCPDGTPLWRSVGSLAGSQHK